MEGEATAPISHSSHLTDSSINSVKGNPELEKPSNNVDRKLRLEQWLTDYWLWEFASWFTSTLLLAGVVLTLSLHQNQPLPEWPFGITINALISFLSSLSTSALIVVVTSIIGQGGWAALTSTKRPLQQLDVYDGASRGPMGSFLFLFQTRLNLVSVGPLIVIASLATAPLVQQLTDIQLTNDGVDTATNFALRNYPNPEVDNQLFDLSGGNPLFYPNIPAIISSGFYQGLYFTGNLTDPFTRNSLQLRPTCPTGNCTYSEFDSLAVCSACANITDQLSISKNNEWFQWALPNGFVSTVGKFSLSRHLVFTGGKYDPLVLQAGLPIVNITAIQPCQKADGTSCGAIAQECMLYWCLNRYSSKVVEGILYEDIVDTVKYGYTINADLLENDTYVFQTNYTSQPEGQESYAKLNVSKWGSAALTDLIAQTLTLNVSHSYRGDNTSTDEMEKLVGYSYSRFPGIPLDMSPAFEAMSLSLTASVRSYRYDETTLQMVAGQSFKQVPHLRVRWPWIALPVVLQVTSLLLLCYMVFWTSRKRLPIWKSSVLAVLFFGARIRDRVPDLIPDQLVDMKALASSVYIRIIRDDLDA
ncbi:hypothetical protein F5Y12DRAFT_722466 [Xylaria sp. FL1777]|nr:hypothetical protein F5Y12DRAFT_722466 [Xylaria sp. FL1777]